jgi:hypothetical protein
LHNLGMPVLVRPVMALPKLRHLTEDEAARRLGISRFELEEANRFAVVAFADPDAEFPSSVPAEAQREAAQERMPKKLAERQRKAEMDGKKPR